MNKLLILAVGRYFFIPPNRMGLELEKLAVRYTVYHTIGIALFGGIVISVRDKLADECGDMADSGTAIQTVYGQKSVLYACNGGAIGYKSNIITLYVYFSLCVGHCVQGSHHIGFSLRLRVATS
jgi:hypothetical protein